MKEIKDLCPKGLCPDRYPTLAAREEDTSALRAIADLLEPANKFNERCHVNGCDEKAVCVAHWTPRVNLMRRCLCVEHMISFKKEGATFHPIKKIDTKQGKLMRQHTWKHYRYARRRGWV